jgi:hypothetical protein
MIMKFSRWIIMKEGTAMHVESQFPDAKKVLYIACVLTKTNQDALVSNAAKWFIETTGHAPPLNWIVRGHHMTVKYRLLQEELDLFSPLLGQDIPLEVISFAVDDFGAAVRVRPGRSLPIIQPNSHITIAHSPDVTPVYSNTLLQKTGGSRVSPLILQSELVCLLLSGNMFPNMINPARETTSW